MTLIELLRQGRFNLYSGSLCNLQSPLKTVQPYVRASGIRKTLQAYTAPHTICMSTPAPAIIHRLETFAIMERRPVAGNVWEILMIVRGAFGRPREWDHRVEIATRSRSGDLVAALIRCALAKARLVLKMLVVKSSMDRTCGPMTTRGIA
jgi:hypothetical protein